MIVVTQHGYDRFKERLGLNKKAAKRMAVIAYDKGISHAKSDGKLYKYISHVTSQSKVRGSDVRLYGDSVYCFKREDNNTIKLCTVYRIPRKYMDELHKRSKRYGVKS